MRAFNEIDWYTYKDQRSSEITNEIQSLTKEYILGVDEDEYLNYLYSKYELEELSIDYDSESYGEPKKIKQRVQSRFRGEMCEVESFKFKISYNFQGDPEIFKISPSQRTLTGGEIEVNSRDKVVSFFLTMNKKDPNQFFKLKQNISNSVFINLGNANKNVREWNNFYKKRIPTIFKAHKQKFIQENSFFEAIKLKTNPKTNKVFTAPTVRKRTIPKPQKSKEKKYSSEPTVSHRIYTDILDIIYESGKSMEKKPSLYKGKDEEGLRDQFLFILETRYEGTTATGETFNRQGKTDILLKYKDGTNLFVAECKFWHGAKEYGDAINQLFDRYLTWRDSKTSLIMFVKNKDMSKVLTTIQEETTKHEYFISKLRQRGETSFSYKFHLPQDKDKIVHLEVMAFHYDK